MPPSGEALVGAVAVAIGTAALTPLLGALHDRWTAETPRVVCHATEANRRLLARCPHLSMAGSGRPKLCWQGRALTGVMWRD